MENVWQKAWDGYEKSTGYKQDVVGVHGSRTYGGRDDVFGAKDDKGNYKTGKGGKDSHSSDKAEADDQVQGDQKDKNGKGD